MGIEAGGNRSLSLLAGREPNHGNHRSETSVFHVGFPNCFKKFIWSPASWRYAGDDYMIRSSAVHFEAGRHRWSHVDEGARFLTQHGAQTFAIRCMIIKKEYSDFV